MDPLDLLGRSDKWFLGGGSGAIYAPPFPRFGNVPGFWDECYLSDLRIPRLFTVLFTRSDGKPVRLTGRCVHWRPDRMVIEHEGDGVRLREFRLVTEGNAWVSEIEILEGGSLQAFLWSLLDVRPFAYGTPWQSVCDVGIEPEGIVVDWQTAWPAELAPDRTAVESERIAEADQPMLDPFPIAMFIGASSERRSYTVNLTQRHDESPLWETSVLPQKLRHGKLGNEEKLLVGTAPIEGLVHIVQQYEVHQGMPVRFVCGAGYTVDEAEASMRDGLVEDVQTRSERSWRNYFSGVPQFRSSDAYLNAAYWYRWYGLRLNTTHAATFQTKRITACQKVAPADRSSDRDGYAMYVTEGIGFFRNFVTYSAQAHLREVAWMHDPSLATGILDCLVACQREDGSYPGHNYTCRPARDFYHADFGTPTLHLHAIHPGAVAKEHVSSLRRYADYLLRQRTTSLDPTGPTLYDVFDQNETGQEYMSRYQFASEDADQWAEFRVHGIDATAYAIALFDTLAAFRAADSTYAAFAEGGRQGLRRQAYDPEAKWFCDVRLDGVRSWARPLTGLYAYLLSGSHLPDDAESALRRWIPEFDLASGFPATAQSDPTFDRDGEWKKRRLNCPWNGRSWPMANSHYVDALAQTARRTQSPILREEAGKALMKAVRLLFHEGDPGRPNSYEHYDPIEGTPALYRGYDDYMHSWIVDLILRHAVGVQPGSDEVDPLPTGVEWIECDRIPHPKGWMRVTLRMGATPEVVITPR